MTSNETYTFNPIGVIHTCFKEKFGIPRQSGLSKNSRGTIKLNKDIPPSTIRDLDGFSHIWVIFVFHKHIDHDFRPTVRPPRLEGTRRVGVFATRSPHRPNPIGFSAVKVEHINENALGGAEITVTGIDILDQTPVLDIKPYIPYADSIDAEVAEWTKKPIPQVSVEFSDCALSTLNVLAGPQAKKHQELITEILALDPRPAFQRKNMDSKHNQSSYGFELFNYDVRWVADSKTALVKEIIPL